MEESSFHPIPPMTSQSGLAGMRNLPNMTIYMDAKPYPTVEKAPPDPATVALLKEDFAGRAGELTGIAQYIFQNIRSVEDETFANAILQIALVEMTHLDMVGDAIQALGGKPSFDDGKYYWQAGEVNYADNMSGMLQADINAEETAIANYERHAAEIKNPQIKALLLRIVEDERLHLRFFTETLENLP